MFKFDDLRHKYSFTTEEIKRDTFYFEIKDNEPVKLGDGTFGVVYQAYDETLQKFAVKLLYENQAVTQAIVQPVVSHDILDYFCDHFKLKHQDPVLEKIKTLQQPIANLSLFTLKLLHTGINDEQYIFLLDKVLRNSRSAAVDRFVDEIQAAKNIREYLQRLGADNLLEGVIETLGGTKKFLSSPAYISLKDTFEASHVSVSNYALVMPLYDKTLKELLENGIGKYCIRTSAKIVENIPNFNTVVQRLNYLTKEELEEEIEKIEDIKSEHKNIINENVYELVGYDILESMNFNERISTILPYLIRIAIGLNALYAADFSHLDLKPANIFVKESEIFDVVIGDLGFLKPEAASEATVLSSVKDYFPLGTRHYRSPEQKDYFDICNVDIIQNEDGFGNTQVSLLIRDPKFRDTIIEEKDYLVFSKDATRVKYEIDKIIKKNDDSIVITLKIDREMQKSLKPEKQTQVVLYKRQAIRTDLFGIGAIAFDLLTCGESPERFYDNIRAYDTEETELVTLMQLYRAVSNFQSSEPRLVHVFTPLKHQEFSSYAPPDIVELILKCMLYKTQQTFYEANRGLSQQPGNYHPTLKAVLDYLKVLGKKYEAKYDDNPLKMRTIKPSKGTHSSILSQRIKDLQNLPLEKLPLRLAQGIWYFKELVKLLRKTIKNKEIFFSELLPENITITDKGMEFSYTVYQKGIDYRNDLKNDSVYTKIMRDISNPYVPDDITFMRRFISLEKVPQKPSNSFYYTFSDSSLLGDHVAVGDWIVINSQLWRITTVSNCVITLEDERGHQASEFSISDDKFINYIYYRNIDPCAYYLSMLGIYLYQIFFVKLGNATVDKPLIINIAKSRIYMKDGSKTVQIKDFSMNKKNAKFTCEPIFQLIAHMYVKLTFFDDRNSFYKENVNDKDRLVSVASEVEDLQEMIGNFVEVKPVALNDLFVEDFESYQTKSFRSKKKIFDTFPQQLDFNHLVRTCLSIQLSEPSLYQEILKAVTRPI